MSTIYGIFHRDLRPVSDEETGLMVSAMHHWLPDASVLFRQDNLMLASNLLYTTPEPPLAGEPSRLGQLRIVADARLDNRDELAVMLGLDPGEMPGIRDDMLILHAYRKFGRKCPVYLFGVFAFVIHDAEKDEIFCARDQLGARPFFYVLHDNHFAFSTEVRGLLSQTFVSKDLNEEYIHCLMAQITPLLSHTFHRFILSLEPAHCLVVERDKAVLDRYWSLRIPPLTKFGDKHQCAEALKDAFTKAVERRTACQGVIGLELSGGLDSSAISAIAAKQSHTDRKKLVAFSNVMPLNAEGKKSYPDEEEFIDAVASFTGLGKVVKIRSSGWKSFLEPLDMALEVNQGVSAYDAWWQEPLRREMSARGVRVVLSGFLGDEGVTAPASSYYRDMLWDGDFFPFLREMTLRREFDLPFKIIGRKFLPLSWIQQWRNRQIGQYKRNSYLRDKALEDKLALLYAEKELSPDASLREQLVYRITRRYTTNRMQSEALYAIGHRLEYRYPFADIRLLEFFLSIPLRFLGEPGSTRYLFREAMKALLPEQVRLRKDKSGAPMIYYWEENRVMGESLLQWARNSLTPVPGRLANLDREKLFRGYDPSLAENHFNGYFCPKRPVESELLTRYFTR